MRIILVLLSILFIAGCQLRPPQGMEKVDCSVSKASQTCLLEPVKAVEPSVPSPDENAAGEAPIVNIDTYAVPGMPSLPEPVDAYLDEESVVPYHGDFPLSDHKRVDKLIVRYTGSQRRTFSRWLIRSGRYIPKIQMVFASEGIPLDLSYLAMIESGFNVRAYSWANAAGPWQFIEQTGQIYGLENNWWQDSRLDLEKSTHAAARHLKYLHKRFDGDWYLAVAAYNAGGGKVRRAVKASKSRDFWTLVDGDVLREETKNYLPKLLATLHIVKNLKQYGFADLDFDTPLNYETITLDSTTDLEIIANFAGVSYEQLKELNPELKRWCTPPGETSYQLHVPFGTAGQIMKQYALLPAEDRARYHRYQIKSGDTLLGLAKKYRIQVDDIIALNKIKNPRAIQIGTNLILPLKEGHTILPQNVRGDSYVRSYRTEYKVRSGDSLWSIARRFSVSEKQLRVWNRLGWSNMLRPGQVLKVSAAGKTRVASTSKKSTPTRKLVYKVVPGDTLWGIGRQFDVATEQIMRWNDLSEKHVLRPGQTLTLLVASSTQG